MRVSFLCAALCVLALTGCAGEAPPETNRRPIIDVRALGQPARILIQTLPFPALRA